MRGLVLCAATLAMVWSTGVGGSSTTQECALDVPEWAPRGSTNTARPRITAKLTSTCGAAIEVSSIRMTVDEEMVTPTTEGTGATVTVSFVPESALVEESDHTVTVQGRDATGTKGERTWTFYLGDTYSR